MGELQCFADPRQQLVIGPGHRDAGVGHDPLLELANGELEVCHGFEVFALVGFALYGEFCQFFVQRSEPLGMCGFAFRQANFLAFFMCPATGCSEQVGQNRQDDE